MISACEAVDGDRADHFAADMRWHISSHLKERLALLVWDKDASNDASGHIVVSPSF